MTGFLVLLAQATLYFAALAATFFYRDRIGIGVFFCALGTMHFMETYLAAVFFINLPFGLVSPGSTILFSGKLALFLLLYIKEDAECMRQPIYGLLGGNILMVVLALILRLYGTPASLPGYNPDLYFLDQMGLLMVWGTALLFVDLIAMVVLYERLGRTITNTIPGRIFISLALVLTFDQVAFYVGLNLLTGAPLSALYGGWIAKMAAAAFFTLAITFYLHVIEPSALRAPAYGASDVFDRLTYRHRYERLAERVGKDALTGLQDRGKLDETGPQMLQHAANSGLAMSLMMIDIDHFKPINDRHGHVVGDQVIREVAAIIGRAKRDADALFRYGGEEFALLCPEPAAGAAALAERIRAAVAGVPFPGLDGPVTISVGIASFPDHARTFRDLLIRADTALYEAKSRGRNRVVHAS